MKHALIIADEGPIGGLVEQSLAGLGFRSFDRAASEGEAVAAAGRRRPDLVVVGIAEGWGIDAARRICARDDLPALLVTAPGVAARTRLPEGARLEGPYPLRDMADAIETMKGPGARAA